jgi:hypothetical protein
MDMQRPSLAIGRTVAYELIRNRDCMVNPGH